MKIAMYFNLPSGGAKRAVYEWTRRLSNAHSIDVFTLELTNHDFCDIRPIVENYHIYPFTTRPLFQSPIGRLNAFQRTRDLNSLDKLHKHIAGQIDNGGYDLVFAHSDEFTFIPILLQYSRTPSVYYLHEPFGPSFTIDIPRPYQKRRLFWKTLNKIDPLLAQYKRILSDYRSRSLHSTTRLLANSEFTRGHMQRSYSIDAPVCYYGVDSENFYPMPEIRKENRVISVGAMTPRKGFDFLVMGLGKIPANCRPQLVIASNFVIQEELLYVQNLAEQYEVQLSVHTHLNTDRLREEYNQARLCVYTPVNEPLGLVPLEAMACGTPVVGVAEGGVKETVRDEVTGVLVPRDPDRFANAVVDLLDDEERLVRFQAQARNYVLECWTWDQSVRSIENQFQQVAQA
jgi:glycosyltransferase involved in cell wall biosynthesis